MDKFFKYVIAALLAFPVWAADFYWNPSVDEGEWENAGNWFTDSAYTVAATVSPSDGDAVFFEQDRSFTVMVAGDVCVGKIVLSSGSALTLSGAGSLSATETCGFSASSVLSINGLTFIHKTALTPTDVTINVLNGGGLEVKTTQIWLKGTSALNVDGGSHVSISGSFKVAPGAAFRLNGASNFSSTGQVAIEDAAAYLEILGGSRFYSGDSFLLHKGASLLISGSSELITMSGFSVGHNSAATEVSRLTIDNSRVCIGGSFTPGHTTGMTHEVIFKGDRPELVIRGGIDSVNHPVNGVNFNFEVPKGGYHVPPVQKISTTAIFTKNMLYYFNILESSPALLNGGLVKTTLFYSYSGSIGRAKVKFDSALNGVSGDGFAFTAADCETVVTDDKNVRAIVCSFGEGAPQAGDSASPNAGGAGHVFSSVARNVITMKTLVSAMPSPADGKTVKALWYASESNDAASMEKVGETVVGAFGPVEFAYAAPNFDKTYYFYVKLETYDKYGNVSGTESSTINKATTVDNTTYLWIGPDGGRWMDEKNWVCADGKNSLGVPMSSLSAARFASGAKGTIDLEGNEITIGVMSFHGDGIDLRFVGDEGAKLSCTYMGNDNLVSAKVVFDGMEFETRSDMTMRNNLSVVFENCGYYSTSKSVYLYENATLEIKNRSTARIYKIFVGGDVSKGPGAGTLIIDDGTCEFTGNAYFGYIAMGGRVILKGKNPKIYMDSTSGEIRSYQAGANCLMELYIPKGGFSEPPFQAKTGHTRRFFQNAIDFIPLKVMADDAILNGASAFSQVLVAWPAAIDTTAFNQERILTDGSGSTVAIENTTNIVAIVKGKGMADAFTVRSSCDEVDTPTPTYGTHYDFENGDVVSCRADATTKTIDGAVYTFKGYVVSNLLENGSYAFRDSGTDALYSYTHGDTAAVLTWLWDVVRDVNYSAPGGNGNVAVTGGTLSNNDPVTLTATPSDGHFFVKWEGDIGSSDPFLPTLTLERDIVRSVEARFGSVLYVSNDGSDDNSGADFDNALLHIQTAIDKAEDGDVIRVAPGIYSHIEFVNMTYAVEINKNITIESTEGPGVTFIDAIDTKSTAGSVRIGEGLERVLVSGFTLRNGTANEYGFHPALNASSGIVSNCILSAKQAGRSGFVRLAGDAVLTDSVVDAAGYSSYNDTPTSCGVRLLGNSLMERCVVKNYSKAAYYNWPVYMSEKCTVRSCLIKDNFNGGNSRGTLDGESTYGAGGAVYVEGGTLENSTIVGNRTRGTGGGVYIPGYSRDNPKAVVCRNNIVYGNIADSGDGNDIWGNPMWDRGRKAFINSCSPDLAGYEGNGNTAFDPKFVNPEEDDYSLQIISPAVNRGKTCAWMDGAADIAGKARVFGGAPDMGAYENCDALDTLACSILAPTEIRRMPATFDVECLVIGKTDGVEMTWDFGDGSATETGSHLSHTYNDYGRYTVTLMVENSDGDVATATHVFTVSPTVAYVSNEGSSEYPYATWETATSSIQDAINAFPRTIMVTNGTYYVEGDSIYLYDDIHIKSVEGPEVTIVDACNNPDPTKMANKDVRIFTMSNDGAVLEGLTFTRGYSANYSFVAGVSASGGLVTNCIFGGKFRLLFWTKFCKYDIIDA